MVPSICGRAIVLCFARQKIVMLLLERLFSLSEHHTSVRTEVLAGLTTFVTIAYIIVVGPTMLHQMGIPYNMAFVGVIALVLIGCSATAFIANLPFALAPGLGLLTYANYVVVQQLHYSWQATLGVVVLTGGLFFLLTVLGLRRMVINAIPMSVGYAIAAGIGFFIGFIALRNLNIVVSNSHSLITLGPINRWSVLLFLVGFVLIGALDQRRVPGAILIGMLIISLVAWFSGLQPITSIVAIPHIPEHLWGSLEFKPWFHWSAMPVVFTFLLVALFDSTGTIIGLSKMLPQDNPRQLDRQVQRALLAESLVTGISGLVGATTASPFIESSSGIKAGGRTGLTALTVAGLFLLLIFFSPLAKAIPPQATSAALFYVACIMAQPIAHIKWQDVTEYLPAVITLITIPLTFSIANGVGIGLICYVLLKLMTWRWRDCHPFLWALFLCFVVYFALG
jgi:AGZA family xanthine/uracil permease-like MFS transporter